MRKKRFTIFHMVLAVVLALALAAGGTVLAARNLLGDWGLTLLQSAVLVNTKFVGDYDGTETADAAVAGLTDGLGDRWSHYLTAEQYTASKERSSNRYVGIGVTIDATDSRGLLILTVKSGGPAEEAGITVGEIITAVDGVDASDGHQSDGVAAVQGAAGTAVELTLLETDGSQRTVSVIRTEFVEKSVTYELLDGGVGLVTVENFYSGCAQQAEDAVAALEAQGATSLIFDMRNDPGGYVLELTSLLDYLMPEGPIFQDTTRSGKVNVTMSDASCVDLPIAVLVNADTYSCAEFFGAELQEEGRAVIVGTETCGKGYSQETFPLPNGGALVLSTGKYCTGSGVSLIGTGVRLDKAVDLDDTAAAALKAGTLTHEDDTQLQAALALLAAE